jgi:hypothetical protein
MSFAARCVSFSLLVGVGIGWLVTVAAAESEHGHPATPFAPFVFEQHKRGDAMTELYRFVDGDSVLRLKVIGGVDRAAAERLIENEVLSTRALYSDALAPYPDALSNRVTVERGAIPEFKSIDKGGTRIQYIVAYLSAGMTYGIQSATDAPYRGVLAWVFCQELKEVRSFELIKPVAHFTQSDEGFALGVVCAPLPKKLTDS